MHPETQIALFDGIESSANTLSLEIEKAVSLAEEIQEQYFSRKVTLADKGSHWMAAIDHRHFATLHSILLDILQRMADGSTNLVDLVELSTARSSK